MNVEAIRKSWRLRRLLEEIAMASLFADAAVSVATLVYLKSGQESIGAIITLLNYVLTAIVVISAVIFTVVLMLKHYDSIYYALFVKNKKRKLRSR